MKRVAIPTLVLLVFAAALSSSLVIRPATAAPEATRWQITPYAGYAFFIDPYPTVNNGYTRVKDNVHYGGSFGWYPVPRFGIQAGGGYTPSEVDAPSAEETKFTHVAGDLVLTLIPQERCDLYALAGGGYERFAIEGDRRNVGSFDFGGGLKLWFAPHWALRAEARNILVLAKTGKPQASRDNYALFTGGLTWAFGGKLKDSDGDGVADRRDQCPDTPAGATVNTQGCPQDSDHDGVFDGLDRCAGSPQGARVDAGGCPTDGDGDGVFDGLDQCADTPKGAEVDAKGCPRDSDGDGVFDGIDQCASTPVGATVDARGCPQDSDGDGVLDGLDKCAGTAAGLKVDRDGCPIEVTEKETELLDTGMIRLQNVNFETGKAEILPESFATLDVVGQVLGKWPELKIEIGGHTDSRGSEAYNQKLSDARATAVQDYLLQKFTGLKADQFTAKGYGESKPLAANNNALNMAKNRRVEFVVQNQEVLRREVERRKLLNK